MYVDLSSRVKSWEILEERLVNEQDMHHVYPNLRDYKEILKDVPNLVIDKQPDIDLYMLDVKEKVFLVHRGVLKPMYKALGWQEDHSITSQPPVLGRTQRDCLRVIKGLLLTNLD